MRKKIFLFIFLIPFLSCHLPNDSEEYYEEVEYLSIINSDGSNENILDRSYGYREKYFVNNDSQILIKGYEEFILMNLDGSIVKRIPINMEMRRSCISYDRSKVSFVGTNAGGQEIYVMDYTGENLRKITDSPTLQKRFPAFSYSGEMLVYTTIENTFPTIEVVNLITGDVNIVLRDTTSTKNSYWYPCFGKDDSLIFFIKLYWSDEKSKWSYALFSINLLTNSLRIVENDVSILGNIVTTSHSNKIVFVGNSSQLHVFVTDYNGLNKIDLGEAPINTIINISDDGSKIVYGNESSYYDDPIIITNIDGSERMILSNGGWPVFSSNASKVLYLIHEIVQL